MPVPALRTTVANSLLKEVICQITPLGLDDSVNAQRDFSEYEWPTEGVTTINLDSMRVQESKTLVSHNAAQRRQDQQRIVGESFSISVNTKLQMDGLDLAYLKENEILGLNCTSQKASFWAVGIVENFEVSYDNPCQLTFSLRSYGEPIHWDSSTAFPNS